MTPQPTAGAAQGEALYEQLRRRLPAWRAAGASPKVLRWLREGARCEWSHGPPPPFDYGISLQGSAAPTPQQSEFFEAEYARHFVTGAWREAPPDQRTHISRVHLVPKKVPEGAPPKWRIVVDLRPTNAYCRQSSCKYETLKLLSRLARRGDWMISFDLQDGYHQVGIHPDSRRYMTFAVPPPPGSPPGTPPRYVQSAALPFGWTASPYIFTKVMRVMVRMLRSPYAPTVERMRLMTQRGRRVLLRMRRGKRHAVGIRCLAYVDDFLALASSRKEALRHRARIERVLGQLGIRRHPDKGWWEPTQVLEHLGLEIDTRRGLFLIPPKKVTELERRAKALIAQAARDRRLIPVRVLAQFAGYGQSVQLACPAARFYLRSIHDVMATRTSWEARVRLTRQAMRDLRWWAQIGSADVRRTIWRAPTQSTLHCDASHLGWGGVLNGTVPASGMWTGRTRGRHINYLELEAVHLTLRAFQRQLGGQSVLLYEDNMTIVHVLTNRTTRSPALMHLLRRVWRLIDMSGITLEVTYIASEANSLADALSRGSPFDNLLTRPSALDEFDRRFGRHTVDRYATAASAVLPRFNTPLPDERGEGAIALASDWLGENNYAFPPVGELPRLAQYLSENPDVSATVLAPYWAAQPWFQLLASVAARVEVAPLAEWARPPPGLPASAQHALSGATLVCFRAEGASLGGSTRAK